MTFFYYTANIKLKFLKYFCCGDHNGSATSEVNDSQHGVKIPDTQDYDYSLKHKFCDLYKTHALQKKGLFRYRIFEKESTIHLRHYKYVKKYYMQSGTFSWKR